MIIQATEKQFEDESFDVVASRQLANCLFDPMAAFSNWYSWLKPGGTVILMDGLFDRASWAGMWQEEVDVLPLSACQTTAAAPYMLEHCGFHIEFVSLMKATNKLPSTRTPRYLVVASKND